MFRSPARATLFLGLAVYATLAILAIVFYLERTVFIDLAFHISSTSHPTGICCIGVWAIIFCFP